MSPHLLCFHKCGFNHFCPLLERQSNIFDFASRNHTQCSNAQPAAAVNQMYSVFSALLLL